MEEINKTTLVSRSHVQHKANRSKTLPDIRKEKPCDEVEIDPVTSQILALLVALSPDARDKLLEIAKKVLAEDRNTKVVTPCHKHAEDSLSTEDKQVAAIMMLTTESNPTDTPTGKLNGCGLLNHEVRCPKCKGIFRVSKFRLKKKIACPFCGQHIIVK